jgi:uncharacterized repeat protein (TIGR01451 family)
MLLTVWTPASQAQVPHTAPPATQLPLLYVRVTGPAGLRVTFYRGGAMQSLAAPFTVGLRPGYRYHIGVSGLPGYPGKTFFPTLEVRGALQMPPKMRAADYPVPLTFSEHDLRAVVGGAFLTRLLLVERPEVAIPEATRGNQPIELTAPSEFEAQLMAEERGRTLLVVRLGQRQWSADDLAGEGIPGTVLCPGEQSLEAARDLPCVPCAPVIFTGNEMCIPDGGDAGLQAGIDSQGRLRGLDPGDTVAQYSDSHGVPHISVSNRVCICVPRYLAIQTEVAPAVQLALVTPLHAEVTNGFGLLLARVPPLAQEQIEAPAALAARQRLLTTIAITGPVAIGLIQGVAVVSTEVAPETVTGTCAKAALVEKPLIIIKWPDRCDAQIGDLVTFYLRYTNIGGMPITDIIVSDSLAPRFEYVPNSARSDRDATFTIRPNEAGSQILRWEVAGALPPGRSGMVSFQVRIR